MFYYIIIKAAFVFLCIFKNNNFSKIKLIFSIFNNFSFFEKTPLFRYLQPFSLRKSDSPGNSASIGPIYNQI